MLSNRGSDTNKIVVADAMKFTYVGPVPEPSGFLALGGGMLALAGVVVRRRPAIREDAARPAIIPLDKSLRV